MSEPPEPPYVDATPTRQHLRYLSSKGIGTTFVARQTGIARSTLVKISNDEKKKFCTKEVERAVFSVFADTMSDHHFVDSKYTRLLVAELRAAGYTIPELNSMLGNRTLHQKLVTGNYVRYWKQKKIEALHFALLRRLPFFEKPKTERQKRNLK